VAVIVPRICLFSGWGSTYPIFRVGFPGRGYDNIPGGSFLIFCFILSQFHIKYSFLPPAPLLSIQSSIRDLPHTYYIVESQGMRVKVAQRVM